MRLAFTCFAFLLAFGLLMPVYGQNEKKDDKKVDPAAQKADDPKGKDDKTDPKGKDDKKDPKGKDDKKDPKGKDNKKDPKTDVKKFSYAQYFSGKISAMSEKTGEMTVEVTQKMQVPVNNAAQLLANYQRDMVNWKNDLANRQVQIFQQKNPFEKQRQIIELQKVQSNPPKYPQLYQTQDKKTDVIVRIGKEMKVRTAFPELQYDNKGNPIPLTPEKAKELQGPEGYPGFPTEFSALHTGQNVQVFVNLPKNSPASKDPKKKGPDISDIIGGGAKNKDQPEEVNPNLPEAVAIMIISEKK